MRVTYVPNSKDKIIVLQYYRTTKTAQERKGYKMIIYKEILVWHGHLSRFENE